MKRPFQPQTRGIRRKIQEVSFDISQRKEKTGPVLRSVQITSVHGLREVVKEQLRTIGQKGTYMFFGEGESSGVHNQLFLFLYLRPWSLKGDQNKCIEFQQLVLRVRKPLTTGMALREGRALRTKRLLQLLSSSLFLLLLSTFLLFSSGLFYISAIKALTLPKHNPLP